MSTMQRRLAQGQHQPGRSFNTTSAARDMMLSVMP
jgi:hypothetical protein